MQVQLADPERKKAKENGSEAALEEVEKFREKHKSVLVYTYMHTCQCVHICMCVSVYKCTCMCVLIIVHHI